MTDTVTSTRDLYDTLESGRKKIRMIYMAYGALYLLALGCYLLSWQAMLCVIAINLLLYFAFYRPQIKAFRTQSKEALLHAEYDSTVEELRYSGGEGIARETVYSAALVPGIREEGYLSREHVTGRYHGAAFEQADVTVYRRHPDDPEDRKKVVWLSGSWNVFALPNKAPLVLTAWETALFTPQEVQDHLAAHPGLALLGQGEGTPLRDFTVCTNDADAAHSLLEGGFARAVKLLREDAKGPVLVGLEPGRLHVLLKGRFGTAEVGLKVPVTPKNTPAQQLPEMGRVFGLADYWMK